jgi:hypothetical protein
MSFAEEPGIGEANIDGHGGTYCTETGSIMCMRRRGDLGVGNTDRYVSKVFWQYGTKRKEKREWMKEQRLKKE